MSEEAKQKLSEYLDKRFAEQDLKAEERAKKLIETLTSTSNKPQKQHTHSANVEFECPECQAEYDKKVKAEAVSEFKKQLKQMKNPTLCDGENCTEVYDAEEKDDCPTCHHRH